MNIITDSFSSHITGKPYSGDGLTDGNVHEFINIASRQKILPMCADVLMTYKGTSLSKQNTDAIRHMLMNSIYGDTIRSCDFLRVYTELLNAGLSPICVKGIVCKQLYPSPSLRASADEDLIIRPEELEKTIELLKKLGFVLHADGSDISLMNDSGLLLELHPVLFRENDIISRFNDLFENIYDTSHTLEIDGVNFYVLPTDDNLLYLVLHAFSHFLTKGIGIRQLCDISLTIQKTNADVEYAFDKCRLVRADGFFNACLLIGEKSFGLDLSPYDFINRDMDIEPLMEDILTGGIYGGETEDRVHSAEITLRAYASSLDNKKNKLLSAVFLPYGKMRTKYSYVDGRPYLLPVAYGDRILGYLSKRHNVKSTIDMGLSRRKMFEYYGIIGEKNE